MRQDIVLEILENAGCSLTTKEIVTLAGVEPNQVNASCAGKALHKLELYGFVRKSVYHIGKKRFVEWEAL